VFDSGIGGLSVLQALQKELPHERFVYLADNAHAPYGEKSETFISQRTHAIAEYLLAQHHIKALVVACNTATAAAIHELRTRTLRCRWWVLEPALKPALALSQTRHIGVMATRGTVASDKFATVGQRAKRGAF
jgi:glutamate racemase